MKILKVLTRCLAGVLAFGLLLLGTGTFLLHTSSFLEKAIPGIAQAYVKNLKVEDLRIRDPKWEGLGSFHADHIALRARVGKKALHAEVKSLKLENIINALFHKAPLTIEWGQADVTSDAGEIRGASGILEVNLARQGLTSFNGKVRVPSAQSRGLEGTEITARISGHQGQARIKEVRAKFYEGWVTGEVLLDYRQGPAYRVESRFDDVDAGRLSRASDAQWPEIEGKVSGTVRIHGTSEEIEGIDVFLHAPAGGDVEARLLLKLFDLMSQSGAGSSLRPVQRELSRLAQKKIGVHLETFRVSVESRSEDSLSSNLNLSSAKLNLDTHVTFVINVEGGLKNLTRFLEPFIQ